MIHPLREPEKQAAVAASRGREIPDKECRKCREAACRS